MSDLHDAAEVLLNGESGRCRSLVMAAELTKWLSIIEQTIATAEIVVMPRDRATS